MIRKADLARILQDSRVRDPARLIAIHIATLGDGFHELSSGELAVHLHGTPSMDTVGRHLRQLLLLGYIERRTGGRGHSDAYRFRSAKSTELNEDRSAKNTELNGDRESLSPPPNAGLSDRSAKNTELKITPTSETRARTRLRCGRDF